MKKEQSQASLALPVEVTESHSIEQNEIKDVNQQEVSTPTESEVRTSTYPIWTPTAFDEFSIV